MLASSRPHDGYIMEYQSSSPVAGNVGIGLSQSIAGVYWQMSFFDGRGWAGQGRARLDTCNFYYFVFGEREGQV